MNRLFLVIFFAMALIGCNLKKDHPSSKIRHENPKKEIWKKLDGKEAVVQLEKLGFFKLTDSTEIEEVKTAFEESYSNLNFFQGKLRGETLNFMDNRYFWVDCEELFEVGGLTHYLGQVQRTFKKLGLKLEFHNEKSEQDQDSWKHAIELNGNEYVAFHGKFSDLDWGIAYVNFLEMLNAELRKQDSNEQFYPISCGNAGAFILLTAAQFDFVSRNYPNDEEHPTFMSRWKALNGL